MSEMAHREEVILLAKNVSKVFPGTKALDNVTFPVYRGKVNALVGANGAGKSTLMKILAGVENPTSGSLVFEGEPIEVSSPLDARRYGIGIIYQELDLFPNLSITDNIFAGREILKGRGVVDTATEAKIAAELLERLREKVDPSTQVSHLRVGQQQLVAIAKALAEDAKVLIMDEPTSALSPAEVEGLFRVIADLKAQGVSIVYISHKLDEIVRIADHATVMRDGAIVAHEPRENVTIKWMVENMVGRPQDYSHNRRSPDSFDDELLKVEGLSLPHPYMPNRLMLDNVSFSVKRGEIVGIFGLLGSGRTELLECLAGCHDDADGSLWIEGDKVEAQGIPERIKLGLVMIPEDRQRDGVVHTLSVKSNITLASLRNYLGRILLSKSKEDEACSQMVQDLSIRVSSPQQLITSLSGGNQQKAIVARALLTSPKVLLMDEPTRGIDVGAKAEIFRTVNYLAEQGYSVILVSSEIDEVLSVSDRIIVLCRGRITGEFDRSSANQDVLMRAATVIGPGLDEREGK
jgi:erythritol transport system ATP-binding protein